MHRIQAKRIGGRTMTRCSIASMQHANPKIVVRRDLSKMINLNLLLGTNSTTERVNLSAEIEWKVEIDA